MKKIEFTESDQKAVRVAAADGVGTETFWDRVAEQYARMTSGPEIKIRQEPPKSSTQ